MVRAKATVRRFLSGCPSDATAIVLADDGKSLELRLRQLIATNANGELGRSAPDAVRLHARNLRYGALQTWMDRTVRFVARFTGRSVPACPHPETRTCLVGRTLLPQYTTATLLP